ncbi:DUF4870 family protein [Crenobacter cavernae]|uniref:Transmembrane protein n=1 Tax=Crenobacter cavernae TaxID=2290923 RepID=A0ABY0FEW5_9NEIS|nr:hypothetical protein [Crenobacter cavernae]RXZ43601.1 hypothetical protein EBB06_09565 [Crenobacter cavernae]
MNDWPATAASSRPHPDKKLYQLTLVVYILQIVSLFVGVTALVGVIVNYIKKPDVAGTVFESHFAWQIRTFWWALAGYVLGFLTTFLLVGFLILFATWVWFIYRVVRGFLAFNDGKPLPA